LDGEGAREGAQDAPGAGDFGEEAGTILGMKEVLHLAGEAAGVVIIDVADEPGGAGGEARGAAGAGRAARAGGARLGECAIAPVREEAFEAGDGEADVLVDAQEEHLARAVLGRKGGDDAPEAGEDGAEGDGECRHYR